MLPPPWWSGLWTLSAGWTSQRAGRAYRPFGFPRPSLPRCGPEPGCPERGQLFCFLTRWGEPLQRHPLSSLTLLMLGGRGALNLCEVGFACILLLVPLQESCT